MKALRYLLGCPRLLVAYDVDAEGEKGAERLAQLSTRVHRIRPPLGKDVTALWQAGGRCGIGYDSSWRGCVCHPVEHARRAATSWAAGGSRGSG